MGSTSNANHEWIELHNSGADVIAVTGWTLSDGVNLSIALEGEVDPGEYVLLKRTSDASAPGPTFLVYTGALVNTGATLTLRRGDGSVVDQVVGGENWQTIGGDNTTKDTAQYTSAGWVTAAPTPGAANRTVATPSPSVDSPDTTTAPQTTTVASPLRRRGSSESVRLELPDVELQLTIDAQTAGYVGQAITFTVTPRGLGDTWLASLAYEWNFGDGTPLWTGQTVTKQFMFPGTYVVTVWAGYGRHEQIARHEITILPTTLSLTTDQAGNVLIHNDAVYEVDLSGFVIQGTKRVTLPPRTIVLPRETITIEAARVGSGQRALVAVYDTSKTLVASNHATMAVPGGTALLAGAIAPTLAPVAPVSAVASSAQSLVSENVSTAPPRSEAFAFASAPAGATLAAEYSATTSDAVARLATTAVPVVAATAPTRPAVWPYMALLLVLALVVMSVVGRGRPASPTAS
jgi:hypothetical protein